MGKKKKRKKLKAVTRPKTTSSLVALNSDKDKKIKEYLINLKIKMIRDTEW